MVRSLFDVPGETLVTVELDVRAPSEEQAAAIEAPGIVFVSAGAGAVGSVVVQAAKAKGMTVIASAGGAEKCDFVRSLGADQVIDYKAGSILKGLAAAAPDGIDVYFDNVGGEHLDAALAVHCKHDLVAFALQPARQHVPVHFVVFDEKNGCHR